MAGTRPQRDTMFWGTRRSVILHQAWNFWELLTLINTALQRGYRQRVCESRLNLNGFVGSTSTEHLAKARC